MRKVITPQKVSSTVCQLQFGVVFAAHLPPPWKRENSQQKAVSTPEESFTPAAPNSRLTGPMGPIGLIGPIPHPKYPKPALAETSARRTFIKHLVHLSSVDLRSESG